MNIELNEQEIKFLKQYVQVYDAERRVDITADPIVVVESQRRISCHPEYGADVCWCDDDGTEWDSLDEVRNDFLEWGYAKDDIEEAINSLSEGNDKYEENGLNLYKFHYQAVYEPVAYFFTRHEAKRYVKYQRHNLKRPRVFTRCLGYANGGDLLVFQKLLLKMGNICESLEVL